MEHNHLVPQVKAKEEGRTFPQGKSLSTFSSVRESSNEVWKGKLKNLPASW